MELYIVSYVRMVLGLNFIHQVSLGWFWSVDLLDNLPFEFSVDVIIENNRFVFAFLYSLISLVLFIIISSCDSRWKYECYC